MRHDDAACADLCKEHGFARPAAVLRAVAEGGCTAYMIRPVDFYVAMSEGAARVVEARFGARPIFLDEAEADRVVAGLNAEGLRGFRPGPFQRTFLIDPDSSDFRRGVAAILGPDYKVPDDPEAPLVPDWASDEQLRAIAPLVPVAFFEVIPVPIHPEGP